MIFHDIAGERAGRPSGDFVVVRVLQFYSAVHFASVRPPLLVRRSGERAERGEGNKTEKTPPDEVFGVERWVCRSGQGSLDPSKVLFFQ